MGYKAAAAEFCLPCSNMQYNELHTCGAHAVHNVAKKCLNETGIVGHAHACSYVFSLDSRRKQLARALGHLVERELVVVEAAPPAEAPAEAWLAAAGWNAMHHETTRLPASATLARRNDALLAGKALQHKVEGRSPASCSGPC